MKDMKEYIKQFPKCISLQRLHDQFVIMVGVNKYSTSNYYCEIAVMTL